ncbi:MAG: QueT transporter family protein [Clostridia bacterium]|nr:QueT transporter family protein [Clostridia bacterium]
MNNKKALKLTQAALVGAMYFVLTWIANACGLASGAVQLRLSEALCVLPYFMPAAIPGLFVGCLITNLSMGSVIWDTLFGSLATLIGAFVASKIKNKWLVPLPTVLSNTVVVPIVILLCYTPGVKSLGVYATITAGVFAGEALSAYLLGMVLLLALDKHKGLFTKNR